MNCSHSLLSCTHEERQVQITCLIILCGLKTGACPCVKKTISRNRFSKILRFLRFGTKLDRSQRLKTDRFALFLVVWNRFIDNCISCYTPGAFVTVDEQLFPCKCRCPFTQFVASKPAKYGQKYWLAVDKDSKYVVSWFPYVGRDETRSKDQRISDRVVMQ